VLKKSGGEKWASHLRQYFYPQVVEFEFEAIRTGPVTRIRPTVPPVRYPDHPPLPVSLEQFFNTAILAPSEPIPLQEKYGGIQVGSVISGQVYKASNQDVRLVLHTRPVGVFFLRDGAIYAQSASGFAHDIIYGAFVVAGQNALGSAILGEMMIDIALSFTPWGAVWDVISAIKALTEGDWKGAALAALPGPAFALASKSRAFRAVGRGAVIAAKYGKKIFAAGVKFIARGAYVINGKLRRGVWLVADAAGTSGAYSYRFLDEVAETIHDVPAAKATDFIICSQCRLPPKALVLARHAEVQDIMEDLIQSPVYASRGKVLVDRKLIDEVVEAYGLEGGDVVRNILTAFESVKPKAGISAVTSVNDTLELAKTLSRIKSGHPRAPSRAVYQDAIDIFADLAAHPFTARGAMFELEWAAKHVDDIAAMGVPIYQKGWRGVGKGLDVMKKNGVAVELKNYDFTSQFYRDDPSRSVQRIIKQAKSRLAYKNPPMTKVTFVFDSRTPMPSAFRRELQHAIKDLEKQIKRKGVVDFEFWPPKRGR
jgi:hypothetical protein